YITLRRVGLAPALTAIADQIAQQRRNRARPADRRFAGLAHLIAKACLANFVVESLRFEQQFGVDERAVRLQRRACEFSTEKFEGEICIAHAQVKNASQ